MALRFEERRAREREVRLETEAARAPASDDDAASRIFERAWAEALVQQAKVIQKQRAAGDEAAQQRVELLEMRFGERLPIRAIAARSNEGRDLLWRPRCKRIDQRPVQPNRTRAQPASRVPWRRLMACRAATRSPRPAS